MTILLTIAAVELVHMIAGCVGVVALFRLGGIDGIKLNLVATRIK